MNERPLHHHWLLKVPVVVAACALLSFPFVAARQHGEAASNSNASVQRSSVAVAGEVNLGPSDPSAAQSPLRRLSDENLAEFVNNPTGSQVSYTRLSDGFHTGTATERFARPALSLIKLYIADYVVTQGDASDVAQAIEMIESSDDITAEQLYMKYPQSIDETAQRYGLLSTRSNASWGYSVTSTFDVVSFVAQKLKKDPTSPVLTAMKKSKPVASDGYRQDFGTAILPGVIGTKWGWSNDLSLHSSVSFGKDFVVAAAVTGSADDLNQLVRTQLGPYFDLPPVDPAAVSTPRPTPNRTSSRTSAPSDVSSTASPSVDTGAPQPSVGPLPSREPLPVTTSPSARKQTGVRGTSTVKRPSVAEATSTTVTR